MTDEGRQVEKTLKTRIPESELPVEAALDKLWQRGVQVGTKEARSLSARGRNLRMSVGKPNTRIVWTGYDPDHFLFLLATIFMPGTEPRQSFSEALLDEEADDLETIRTALVESGIQGKRAKNVLVRYGKYLEEFKANGRWPYRFGNMMRFACEADELLPRYRESIFYMTVYGQQAEDE